MIFQKSTLSTANNLRIFTKDLRLLQRITSFAATAYNTMEHSSLKMTPTLKNFIVLTWLWLVHPDLPKLVKQHHGTELHSRTLASIKPEISQALQSLLDEICATEVAKVMHTATSSHRRPAQAAKPTTRFRTRPKSSPFCTQAGSGDFHHYLSDCTYLSDTD